MKKLFLTLMAVAAIMCISCKKENKPTPKPGPDGPDNPDPEEPEYVQPITIDGDFSDWAKLDASKVAVAKGNANALFTTPKEIRVYADELFVFFYLEYDNAAMGEMLVEGEGLPIRLDFNTDGEFESGYHKYFQESYDFMIEGSVASNGQWASFDGGFYQRIDGGWTDPALLAEGSGMCSGAGSGNKYEICLIREMVNAAAGASTVPMPMGDEFQCGVTFYTPSWGELGALPNDAVSDDDAKGWGHMLNVTTVH